MYIPLHYQVSEYDCVPTAFMNAVSYLFQRHEIPPMVIRHIYTYSLDTVGRRARLGRGGTSIHAIRLLGSWLNAYKTRKFSVNTRFLEGNQVHLGQNNLIFKCLENGGVALCKVLLGRREEHYVMVVKVEDGWVYCFDPYCRVAIRRVQKQASILKNEDGHAPNLKIRLERFVQEDENLRFCLGPLAERECLLVWRNY